MRQGKSMTARELQDILNLLPPGAKDVVVNSTRDCKITASVPNGPAWAQVSIVWQFINQPSYAKEPGFTRVMYCGPRSEGK